MPLCDTLLHLSQISTEQFASPRICGSALHTERRKPHRKVHEDIGSQCQRKVTVIVTLERT